MKATDEELESAEVSCERWTWGCGGVVVAGLIFEFAIAIANPSPPSDWERWGTPFADIIVTLGVAGEVLFSSMGFSRSRESQRRSSDKLADALTQAAAANDRAAEAYTELTWLRLPRTVEDDNATLLAARLRPFAGTKFDIGIDRYNGEQHNFLWSFGPALQAGGWIWADWLPHSAGDEIHLIRFSDRPMCATVAACNVEIHIHEEARVELLPAAETLVAVLAEIGIEASFRGFNLWNRSNDRIHITIGERI